MPLKKSINIAYSLPLIGDPIRRIQISPLGYRPPGPADLRAMARAEHAINAPHLASLLRIDTLILFISTLNGAQIGAFTGFEAFKIITLTAGFRNCLGAGPANLHRSPQKLQGLPMLTLRIAIGLVGRVHDLPVIPSTTEG